MMAFARGDEKAFRELFAKHQKNIINFCYRFCCNRQVAEELAQEVFVRVYRAAERYRPDARFSTWLYRIAVNVCLNETRKRNFQVKIESIDQPVQLGHSEINRDIEDQESLSPQDVIDAGERERMIQQAMSALPEKQRAALLLRVFNEFSYQQISRQMEISEANVKSLIHKGRQRLQELLAGYFKSGNAP
ncbi:MAG: RNA polymerase sigma factor [Desulfobacterales bacterium]|nr:RNA polymerase sigma factor [Desulfobacterales bacterium]